jgi:hypothetical protein
MDTLAEAMTRTGADFSFPDLVHLPVIGPRALAGGMLVREVAIWSLLPRRTFGALASLLETHALVPRHFAQCDRTLLAKESDSRVTRHYD